jgi:hypothetical protein
MRRWSEGRFTADWRGRAPAAKALDALPPKDRPRALDRAALEACVGGGFFPGIEVGRMMLDPGTYDRQRPFRVSPRLAPGTLTARMAVPWQADFFDCQLQPDGEDGVEGGMDWWPGQRPVNVWRDGAREPWVPPAWKRPERMVEGWSRLGFVRKQKVAGTDADEEYVEVERSV